jgi:hypothetical protein
MHLRQIQVQIAVSVDVVQDRAGFRTERRLPWPVPRTITNDQKCPRPDLADRLENPPSRIGSIEDEKDDRRVELQTDLLVALVPAASQQN